MIGGWIIDITPISKTAEGRAVSRLWCVDRYGDECAVHVENEPAMPMPGDEIWWQAGKVYWDNDRQQLKKVGNSYSL